MGLQQLCDHLLRILISGHKVMTLTWYNIFTGSSWWRPSKLEEVCRANSTQEPGKPWNNFIVGVFYNLDNKIWKYQNMLIALYFTFSQHKFSIYIIYAVNWILNLLECQGLSGASPSFALRAFASSISSWSLEPVALSRDLDLCLRLQSIIESTFKVQTEIRNMIWFVDLMRYTWCM